MESGIFNRRSCQTWYHHEIPSDGMIEIGNTGFRLSVSILLQNNATIFKEISAILRYRRIFPIWGPNATPMFKQNTLPSLYCPLEHAGVFMDGIKRPGSRLGRYVSWINDHQPCCDTNETLKQAWPGLQTISLPDWMNGMSAYSPWCIWPTTVNGTTRPGDIDFLKKHSGLYQRINPSDKTEKWMTGNGKC